MDFLQLEGKNFVVFGVANRKSVAFHVGKTLEESGAKVFYVVRTEERRTQVQKILDGRDLFVCDVEFPNDIQRVASEISQKTPVIHGLLHSIAFADYSEGFKPFHETGKSAFLRTVDISCYSLISISNAFQKILDRDASVVTVSISTTRMASENYGFMAPVKAALDALKMLRTRAEVERLRGVSLS